MATNNDRPRVNACTETALISGVEVTLVPADARVGGFTYPASQLCDSPETALTAAIQRGHKGDLLIRKSMGRWQAFERRQHRKERVAVKGGGTAEVTKRVREPGAGTRAVKTRAGSGRVFFQE
jgi:hypothetical protein